MTTQSTTTEAALEPCPWCPTTHRTTHKTEGGIVGIIIHDRGCFFAALERRQVLTPKGVEAWNSRIPAPSVAPVIPDGQWQHVQIKAGNPRVVAIQFETAEQATAFINTFAAAPASPAALRDEAETETEICPVCKNEVPVDSMLSYNNVPNAFCQRCVDSGNV